VPSIVIKLAASLQRRDSATRLGYLQISTGTELSLSTRVAGCRAARERGRGGHGTT